MTDLATFPVLLGQGITVHKLPKWNTTVAGHASGRESRARRFQWPLWDFELTFEGLDANDPGYYGSLGAATMQVLAGFFDLQQGAYNPFIYVDPTDNSVVGQFIAIGDGSTTVFPMVRSIGPFTGPVDIVTTVTEIYVNGVITASTITNGYPYPAVTFSVAPSSGAVITADFSYAYLVRFSEDIQDFEEFMSRLLLLKSLKFQSVRIREPVPFSSPPINITPPLHGMVSQASFFVYESGLSGGVGMFNIDPTSNVIVGYGNIRMPPKSTGTFSFSIVIGPSSGLFNPTEYPSALQIYGPPGVLTNVTVTGAGTYTGSGSATNNLNVLSASFGLAVVAGPTFGYYFPSNASFSFAGSFL